MRLPLTQEATDTCPSSQRIIEAAQTRQEARATMFGYSFMRRTSTMILWALCIVLVLAAASVGSVAWAVEQLPVARIVNVESPSSISPGQDFDVVVAVDYSAQYSTDIAILDSETGYVLASKGLIIPAGRNLFTFSLTSRDQLGPWALMASVRVWWHDGWYASGNDATFPFQIDVLGTANAVLNVRSNLASTVVTVDGVSYSVSTNGAELSTTRGFHTIEVESLLSLDNGTRAVFDHWSDGVRSSAREVYVVDRLDLFAIYLAEYFLSVKSNAGETVGSGWYPAGTNATFAALDPAMVEHGAVDLQAAYKFSQWSGDFDSTLPIGWVVMDRPKTVVASWAEDVSRAVQMAQLVVVSLVLLSCSAILIAVGFILRRKQPSSLHHAIPSGRTAVRGLLIALFFLAVLAHSPAAQPANALTPIQPASVTIGDAVWYHWNRTTSDTLLIWLGGGIVEQTAFLVNPYEYESYNTIRFIQDLAAYYDVIALKKGSIRQVEPTLNRTFYREPYPSSNNFMMKIRSWATEQGYTYLYVVGYSVGAMAAAQELVLANPGEWTSPDGLIIITTKISERATSNAASLRASLLMLYGDKIAPEFTASGESFYRKAPEEGWRDGFWYHKEYHVIPDVEHEVWTIRDSGEYDKRAVLLTVKFIETSKSLQFEPVREGILRIAANRTAGGETDSGFKLRIRSVGSPSSVRTQEAFAVNAAVVYDLPSQMTVAVVTYDIRTGSISSAAERELSGGGEAWFVSTLVSGDHAETLQLTLIPLIGTADGWTVVRGGITDLVVEVADSCAITLVLGHADVPVEFDGAAFLTGTDGEVTINASAGEHTISVPAMIVTGDMSRAIFQQWNDTLSAPTMRLLVSRDVSLLAIYRRQYYLNVTSPFGQATGTGWYDEYGNAQFRVTPPVVVQETTHAFTGWSGDSHDASPASTVFMNGSKTITASWTNLKLPEEDTGFFQVQAFFIISAATLLGSLIFVAISFHRRRRTVPANYTPFT